MRRLATYFLWIYFILGQFLFDSANSSRVVTQKLSVCTSSLISGETFACGCIIECENEGICSVDSSSCNCTIDEYVNEGNFTCEVQYFILKYEEAISCFGLISTDPTVCSLHGECVEENLCTCSSWLYQGEECEQDVFSYLIFENLKTSLWAVILAALIILISVWVIVVKILVISAKRGLNKKINQMKVRRRTMTKLHITAFQVEDLLLLLKLQRSPPLASFLQQLDSQLRNLQTNNGLYYVKQCLGTILRVYMVIYCQFFDVERLLERLSVGKKSEVLSLAFIKTLLMDGVEKRERGDDAEILKLELEKKIYSTKMELNEVSSVVYAANRETLEKYEKKIPRNVIVKDALVETFDVKIKILKAAAKCEVCKNEKRYLVEALRATESRIVEVKERMANEMNVQDGSGAQDVKEDIREILQSGLFGDLGHHLEKKLQVIDVVLDMDSEGNGGTGLDKAYRRLDIRSRSKWETLVRQRIESLQIEIEETIDEIHNAVETNKDSEARYHVNILLPKIEENLFCLDTPFNIFNKITKMLKTLLLSNENNSELLELILKLTEMICMAVFFHQKKNSMKMNFCEKNEMEEVIGEMSDRLGNDYKLGYRLQNIRECLLLVEDNSSFFNEFMSSISLTEPMRLVSLLKKTISQAHSPISFINRTPYYVRLLTYYLTFRLNSETIIGILTKWNPRRNKFLIAFRLDLLKKFARQVFKERGVNKTSIPSEFVVSQEMLVLPASSSLAVVKSECEYVKSVWKFGKQQVVPENFFQNSKKTITSAEEDEKGNDDVNKLSIFNKSSLASFVFTWNLTQRCIDMYSGESKVRAITTCNAICQEARVDVNWNVLKENNKNDEGIQSLISELEIGSSQFYYYGKYLQDVLLNQSFLQMKLNLAVKQHSHFNGSRDNDCGDFLNKCLADNRKILLTALGGGGKTCLQVHMISRLRQNEEVYGFFIRGNVLSSFFRPWRNASLSKKIEILITCIIQSFQEKVFTVFPSACDRVELRVQLKEIMNRSKPLMFCFDAFDEIPILERSAFLNIFMDLQACEDLNIVKLIISSRPEDIDPLHRENLIELLKSVLEHNQKEKEEIDSVILVSLVDSLRFCVKNVNLRWSLLFVILKRLLTVISLFLFPIGINNTPAFHSIKTEARDDQEIKANLFLLYEHLINGCLRFSRKKYSDNKDSISQCSISWVMNVLSIVGYVNHTWMMNMGNRPNSDNVSFKLSKYFESVIGEERWIMNRPNPIEWVISSLVRCTSILTENKSYLMFSHQTIQEFFCARLMINPDESRHIRKIQEAFQGTMELCFQFLGKGNPRNSANVGSLSYPFWKSDSSFFNVCRFFFHSLAHGRLESLECESDLLSQKSFSKSAWLKLLEMCDQLPRGCRSINLKYLFQKYFQMAILSKDGRGSGCHMGEFYDVYSNTFVRDLRGQVRRKMFFLLNAKPPFFSFIHTSSEMEEEVFVPLFASDGAFYYILPNADNSLVVYEQPNSSSQPGTKLKEGGRMRVIKTSPFKFGKAIDSDSSRERGDFQVLFDPEHQVAFFVVDNRVFFFSLSTCNLVEFVTLEGEFDAEIHTGDHIPLLKPDAELECGGKASIYVSAPFLFRVVGVKQSRETKLIVFDTKTGKIVAMQDLPFYAPSESRTKYGKRLSKFTFVSRMVSETEGQLIILPLSDVPRGRSNYLVVRFTISLVDGEFSFVESKEHLLSGSTSRSQTLAYCGYLRKAKLLAQVVECIISLQKVLIFRYFNALGELEVLTQYSFWTLGKIKGIFDAYFSDVCPHFFPDADRQTVGGMVTILTGNSSILFQIKKSSCSVERVLFFPNDLGIGKHPIFPIIHGRDGIKDTQIITSSAMLKIKPMENDMQDAMNQNLSKPRGFLNIATNSELAPATTKVIVIRNRPSDLQRSSFFCIILDYVADERRVYWLECTMLYHYYPVRCSLKIRSVTVSSEASGGVQIQGERIVAFSLIRLSCEDDQNTVKLKHFFRSRIVICHRTRAFVFFENSRIFYWNPELSEVKKTEFKLIHDAKQQKILKCTQLANPLTHTSSDEFPVLVITKERTLMKCILGTISKHGKFEILEEICYDVPKIEDQINRMFQSTKSIPPQQQLQEDRKEKSVLKASRKTCEVIEIEEEVPDDRDVLFRDDKPFVHLLGPSTQESSVFILRNEDKYLGFSLGSLQARCYASGSHFLQVGKSAFTEDRIEFILSESAKNSNVYIERLEVLLFNPGFIDKENYKKIDSYVIETSYSIDNGNTYESLGKKEVKGFLVLSLKKEHVTNIVIEKVDKKENISFRVCGVNLFGCVIDSDDPHFSLPTTFARNIMDVDPTALFVAEHGEDSRIAEVLDPRFPTSDPEFGFKLTPTAVDQEIVIGLKKKEFFIECVIVIGNGSLKVGHVEVSKDFGKTWVRRVHSKCRQGVIEVTLHDTGINRIKFVQVIGFFQGLRVLGIPRRCDKVNLQLEKKVINLCDLGRCTEGQEIVKVHTPNGDWAKAVAFRVLSSVIPLTFQNGDFSSFGRSQTQPNKLAVGGGEIVIQFTKPVFLSKLFLVFCRTVDFKKVAYNVSVETYGNENEKSEELLQQLNGRLTGLQAKLKHGNYPHQALDINVDKVKRVRIFGKVVVIHMRAYGYVSESTSPEEDEQRKREAKRDLLLRQVESEERSTRVLKAGKRVYVLTEYQLFTIEPNRSGLEITRVEVAEDSLVTSLGESLDRTGTVFYSTNENVYIRERYGSKSFKKVFSGQIPKNCLYLLARKWFMFIHDGTVSFARPGHLDSSNNGTTVLQSQRGGVVVAISSMINASELLSWVKGHGLCLTKIRYDLLELGGEILKNSDVVYREKGLQSLTKDLFEDSTSSEQKLAFEKLEHTITKCTEKIISRMLIDKSANTEKDLRV